MKLGIRCLVGYCLIISLFVCFRVGWMYVREGNLDKGLYCFGYVSFCWCVSW